MTINQVKEQAVGRLMQVYGREYSRETLEMTAELVLEVFRFRDAKKNKEVHDGREVEVPVPAFKFDGSSVLWLERQIRRTLGI